MITNLFNIFDPSTSNILNINWISLLLPIIMIPWIYFFKLNRIILIMFNINNIIINDLKKNINNFNFKSLILFILLFIIIYKLNILSIFPFIFTPTRHLSISITLALPFWLSLIIKGLIETPIFIFAHLVPINTPLILSPFIVIIETIRTTIRPLTLRIRLTANIVAGHVLISLLSASLINATLFSSIISTIILYLLIILEISVRIIQRYVFIILLSLYLNEIKP